LTIEDNARSSSAPMRAGTVTSARFKLTPEGSGSATASRFY
jgi:hypothetical protein